MLLEQGLPWKYPNEMIVNKVQSTLKEVLEYLIKNFECLMESFIKKDIISQNKYLNELYLSSSQLQCIAAKSRLDT
jgi:hypothetical protein